MPVLLDDHPLQGRPGVDQTIADALEVAKAHLAGTGRIVLAMSCDNRELPADQLEAFMPRSISEFSQVRFVSGRCEALAVETIRDAQRELSESFVTIQEAAQQIAAGELAGAMQRLAVCLTTWSQIHQAVVLIGQLLKIDFEKIEAGDRSAMRWLEIFAYQLRDLKDAVMSRDHVLLGDLLRYELDETLRGWEQVLASIRRHVEAATNLE